jgi:hypothetical protein
MSFQGDFHEGVPEERQVQVTRYGRVIRPPVRFQDYLMNQALQHIDQGKEIGRIQIMLNMRFPICLLSMKVHEIIY